MRKRTSREGFTLFELVLVVAVLVMVAALAVPAFQVAFKSQRLKKAADLVRGEWSRAKISAIRNGEEFAFFYEPDSGTYWIAPFSSAMATPDGPTNPNQTVDNYDYGHGQLPKGVQFDSGQAVEDARSIIAAQDGNVSGAANMILFYPDGTCQDAELYLRNDNNLRIRVSIRALTGVATVGDLESAGPSGR